MNEMEKQVRQKIWQQWDKQVERRKQQLAWIELSNSYIRIERSGRPITRQEANRLGLLLDIAYPEHSFIKEWWLREFEELPGWDQY